MLDTPLITLVIELISAGLDAQDITADIKQKFQPTQQGVPTAPTVFIYKLFDSYYGSQKRDDEWVPDYMISEDGGYLLDESGQFVLDENGNKILSEASHYILDENGNKILSESQGVMQHTETQIINSTFQLSTLSTQDPANLNQLTASDLLNAVAAIMRSESTKDALLASDVQIFRMTEARNPYFQNDRRQNQANPSFDFILSHKQVTVTTSQIIQAVEFNVARV